MNQEFKENLLISSKENGNAALATDNNDCSQTEDLYSDTNHLQKQLCDASLWDNRTSISVINPTVIAGPSSQFVVYEVLKEPHRVQRRFTEFLQLRKLITANHPGVIVPSLPPKTTWENRFSEDFLEIRRSALESFLRWLQWIPELSESAEFLSFCTTQSSFNNDLVVVEKKLQPLFSTFFASKATLLETSSKDMYLEQQEARVTRVHGLLAALYDSFKELKVFRRELYLIDHKISRAWDSSKLGFHSFDLRKLLALLAATKTEFLLPNASKIFGALDMLKSLNVGAKEALQKRTKIQRELLKLQTVTEERANLLSDDLKKFDNNLLIHLNIISNFTTNYLCHVLVKVLEESIKQQTLSVKFWKELNEKAENL